MVIHARHMPQRRIAATEGESGWGKRGFMSLIKTPASSMPGLTPGGTVDWRRAEQLHRRASPLNLPWFGIFLQPCFNGLSKGLKLDPALKAARGGSSSAQGAWNHTCGYGGLA